jgi:hypothetical protein
VKRRVNEIKVGDQFGRLTIIDINCENRSGVYYHRCRCSCGKEVTRGDYNLRKKLTFSCGCNVIEKHTKHNRANTRIYWTWVSMVERCHTPKSRGYKNYGSRGIYVCDEWRKDFASFYKCMGDPPPGKSLDRINNDGPYSPENCKWSSVKTQALNRRSTTRINILNHDLPLAAIAAVYGKRSQVFKNRLNRTGSIFNDKWQPDETEVLEKTLSYLQEIENGPNRI